MVTEQQEFMKITVKRKEWAWGHVLREYNKKNNCSSEVIFWNRREKKWAILWTERTKEKKKEEGEADMKNKEEQEVGEEELELTCVCAKLLEVEEVIRFSSLLHQRLLLLISFFLLLNSSLISLFYAAWCLIYLWLHTLGDVKSSCMFSFMLFFNIKN